MLDLAKDFPASAFEGAISTTALCGNSRVPPQRSAEEGLHGAWRELSILARVTEVWPK
jgi:hypothetical protein